jgi:hypothetical protein
MKCEIRVCHFDIYVMDICKPIIMSDNNNIAFIRNKNRSMHESKLIKTTFQLMWTIQTVADSSAGILAFNCLI